jgi:hypothetical protein
MRLFCNITKVNYSINGSFFTLDMLVYSLYINNFIKTKVVFESINHIITISKSFKYLIYRALYFCLFEENLLLNICKSFLFPKSESNITISPVDTYNYIYDFLYDYIYVSNYLISNKAVSIVEDFSFQNINRHRAANINLNRFLKYSY